MPSSPSENSFAPLLHALHYFDCSSHCDCNNHHHCHQCRYHLRHCRLNLHLMTSSPPSVTGFALLWLLSQDYSLVSHHPPSYFSAPTWQVASKSLTTRTMMEGTGRKTADYIWVSLLPCSNFSHRGCYGCSTLYPHISETWQFVQTFKEKNWTNDEPSVLDLAQLEQDQRLGLPSISLLHQRPSLDDH